MATEKHSGGRGGKDYPFSASQAKAFEWCELQYWFEYISGYEPVDTDTRYADLGSAVHEAIEYALQQDDTPFHEEVVPRYYERAEHYDVPDSMVADGEKYARKAAKVIRDEDAEITEVEAEIPFTLGGPNKPVQKDFNAKIDIIADGKEIWDWKTGKIKDEILQATTYKAAFVTEYGFEPTTIKFVYLKEGEIHEYNPDEDDLANLAQKVKAVHDAIDNGRFRADSNDKKCQWCSYQYHCPARQESFAGTSWDDFTSGISGW